MVNISRLKRNFNKSSPAVKGTILILMIVLLFAIMISFTYISPFTITNIEGKTEYVAGETQSFRIYLKTVDPEQFRTENYYREQYGRWRIEDSSQNVISSGRIALIDNGLYDELITITIPEQESTLITEIVEYQWSSSGSGTYIVDDGTVRVSEEIELTVKECSGVSDCSSNNICSGKTVSCSDAGYCEAVGTCLACNSAEDCSVREECVQGQCFPIYEPTAIEEFKESFQQPITHTGKSVDGTPAPSVAPKWLIYGNLGMLVLIGVLIFVAQKRR